MDLAFLYGVEETYSQWAFAKGTPYVVRGLMILYLQLMT